METIETIHASQYNALVIVLKTYELEDTGSDMASQLEHGAW